MKKVLLITGLIFAFVYSCYAGNNFSKGYYCPKQTSRRSRGRVNPADGVFNNSLKDGPAQTIQTQELKTFITYYDQPDYGGIVIRDDGDEKLIHRDKIKRNPKDKRDISEKQNNSTIGYTVRYDEEE